MALVQKSVAADFSNWTAERIGPLLPFLDDRCPTRAMSRAVTRSLGRATRSATGRSMIPIALFADLIDGVDDPGIAGQCGEASGLVM